MNNFSPLILAVIIIAAFFILGKIARRILIYWIILIVLELVVISLWPKSLELVANLVAVIRTIIK